MTDIAASQAFAENSVRRFDAEYFSKRALGDINALKSVEHESIEEFADVTDGIHTSIPFAEDGTVKIISAKHPKNGYFELANFECVTEEFHQLNPRTALRENDVLISTVGTIGNSAVVDAEMLPANSDRHVGIIRIRGENIHPLYLSTFLNSEYGRVQSVRESTGNVQLNLFISKINTIIVPRFSTKFEGLIVSTVSEAKALRKKSADLADETETLLLSALGLEQWQPPEALTYERSASEVFGAGRLDAEHFKPKFYAVWEEAKLATGIETIRLGEIIHPVKNGFDFRDFSENGTPYIRVGDVKNLSIDTEGAAKVGISQGDFSKDIQLIEGDILFTRKGSFGNAAVVRAGQEDCIISSEIMLVRIKTEYSEAVLPDYLGIFLESRLGKLQSEQWAHGVAFYSISQADFENYRIPLLDLCKQVELMDKIVGSQAAQKQSTQLLETAKRAVEMAIEESEAAALEHLHSAENLNGQ